MCAYIEMTYIFKIGRRRYLSSSVFTSCYVCVCKFVCVCVCKCVCVLLDASLHIFPYVYPHVSVYDLPYVLL